MALSAADNSRIDGSPVPEYRYRRAKKECSARHPAFVFDRSQMMIMTSYARHLKAAADNGAGPRQGHVLTRPGALLVPSGAVYRGSAR